VIAHILVLSIRNLEAFIENGIFSPDSETSRIVCLYSIVLQLSRTWLGGVFQNKLASTAKMKWFQALAALHLQI